MKKITMLVCMFVFSFIINCPLPIASPLGEAAKRFEELKDYREGIDSYINMLEKYFKEGNAKAFKEEYKKTIEYLDYLKTTEPLSYESGDNKLQKSLNHWLWRWNLYRVDYNTDEIEIASFIIDTPYETRETISRLFDELDLSNPKLNEINLKILDLVFLSYPPFCMHKEMTVIILDEMGDNTQLIYDLFAEYPSWKQHFREVVRESYEGEVKKIREMIALSYKAKTKETKACLSGLKKYTNYSNLKNLESVISAELNNHFTFKDEQEKADKLAELFMTAYVEGEEDPTNMEIANLLLDHPSFDLKSIKKEFISVADLTNENYLNINSTLLGKLYRGYALPADEMFSFVLKYADGNLNGSYVLYNILDDITKTHPWLKDEYESAIKGIYHNDENKRKYFLGFLPPDKKSLDHNLQK